MHIKTGAWEAATTVCESDPLCDPAVLVSSVSAEPHVRNRRLSPGSGRGGGGGGGGCIQEASHQPAARVTPRQTSPSDDGQGPALRKDKERKAQKGRSSRRESHKAKERRASQKERCWVEDSLSLLKPPPAFPVQDSPAKLQPAVSYASKVKARSAAGDSGALEEERPAIGVLLQNQWGLSFISEARAASDSSGSPSPKADCSECPSPKTEVDPRVEEPLHEPVPSPAASPPASDTLPPQEDHNNSKLLLSCRHLVEAFSYHSREWNTICSREKKDPSRVVWYNGLQENPA
ncbi:unnamed protein product [Knipowitschia caucasica]|uniref:Uncharacterized protein n=1 Tax=Knipowitschia caucasica TaxID=637954 RepID=A0AAV2IWE4_KNICA